jgi:hypothetical protein
VWVQAMARLSLRRLFWVHSSARLHHVGGSGAATCPEKVVYSKASTVVRTPTGECQTPGYTDRTPRIGPGPPGIQFGPPRLVPNLHVCKPDPWDRVWTPPPSVRGPGRPQWGPKDPGGGPVQTRVRTKSGADLSAYASAPRPGGDPMLPCGLLRVT